MLHLLVRVFQDAFIREAHQSGGQTLHLLPSLHFPQVSRVEALAHQREFRFRHRASIMASATPFCFCTTQKCLTVERTKCSRA
jgi:hypothetical protein